MNPALRFSVPACLLVTVVSGYGQAAAEAPTVPVRSVAVVVDVSGSVSQPLALEARGIITDIVGGRGFRAGSGWVCNFDAPEPEDPAGEDLWPQDDFLKAMYQPYWAGTDRLQKPLTGAGKLLYLASCGTLQTTMKPPRLWDLGSAQEFEALLTQEYPNRADQFRDGRTCYYIAVARTADRLLQRSDEGCYLFIVSDEWDDPDSKHSPVTEWMPYLEAAGIYDTRYQSAMRNRFRELKDSDRFHLIARFHKGDRPKRTGGSKSYLRVAWYAIGEKPKPVEPPPPPPPAPKPEDPPPPPKPQPPVFGRTLTLLGGLTPAHDAAGTSKPDGSRVKVFDHPDPFIAWQVEGVSASSVDSQFEVAIHRVSDGGTLESVQKLKSAQLMRTSEGRLRGLPAGTKTQPLANGIYRVTIEEKPATTTVAGAAKVLDPVATWIEVKTPFNWVPWLLGVSLLGAAGVIGYSVWSLRR
jgi:hypothetical protein